MTEIATAELRKVSPTHLIPQTLQNYENEVGCGMIYDLLSYLSLSLKVRMEVLKILTAQSGCPLLQVA